MRRTKLHATLGPASADEATLRGLIEAGLDGCRINFSHAAADQARKLVELVRRLSPRVAIRQDLQGPRIRVGRLPGGSRRLEVGEIVTLTPEPGSNGAIPIDCPELFGALERGRPILLDEGQLELRVTDVGAEAAHCEVVHGGLLQERKGLNLPGTRLPLPALSAKDRADLAIGVQLGVDFVSLSFVQSAEDVREARRALAALGATSTRLVAKIERAEALSELDQILDQVDGISIARGDLGLEVGIENLPSVQSTLVAACRRRGRLVQIGGEVLHTMVGAPRPTRSEVADVALMVSQGVDGISLSGETAVGRDPIAAVQILERVVRRAEQVWDEQHGEPRPRQVGSTRQALELASERRWAPLEVAADESEARWLGCHWGVRALG
jgi:pyruvate kinase